MNTFIIFYLLLFLLVSYFIHKNNKKIKITGGYAGFSTGILIYYIAIPLTIFLFKKDFIDYYRMDKYIFSSSYSDYLFSILIITIGFASFHLGYKFSMKYKFKINNYNRTDSNDYYLNKKTWIIYIYRIFGYLTLIIGGVSLIAIIISVGSIGNLLEMAETVRGHEIGLADFIGIQLARLVLPARLITVSPFLFYLLILNRNKLSDKVIFVVSFILAIIFYFFNAGRSPLIMFILSFLYIFAKKRFNKVWIKFLALAIIALPLLDVLNNTFVYFQTGIWYPIEIEYRVYVYDFSYPFMIILNLGEIVSIYGFRYGKDFITDILSLLPGINFETSFINISEFINGINWRQRGGVPTDIMTFGYIQFGVVGVIFILLIIGFVFGKIDLTISKISNKESKNLISIIMALCAFGIVRAADIKALIQNKPIFIIFTVIILLFSKNKKTKRKVIISHNILNKNVLNNQ